MNQSQFEVNMEKCIGCSCCINVCPGGILYLDDEKKATIIDFKEFGWNGCWKCEHCLAVCPTGAVSIFGHHPEDSLPLPDPQVSGPVIDQIVAGRRSCRRYLDKNVDPELTDRLMTLLASAPNGGNKQQVEFTLIDDKRQMQIFHDMAYQEMERLAAQGIFPEGFDRPSYEDMKGWETTVRPDMLFCGAPHILIPHAPLGIGEPVQDVLIAGTYFELLCAAHGLGSVMLTFPLSVLHTMPKIRAMLEIPEDHYIGMIIGFGYPQIKYRRGVQKTMDPSRVHRLFFG